MPRKAITKEEKHAARQEKHWPNLGGIVVDVKSPLHSNARMLGRKHIDVNEKLSRDEREILSSVEASMLTASHALDQVLHGLNDESHNWFPQNPENFPSNEEIREMHREIDLVQDTAFHKAEEVADKL